MYDLSNDGVGYATTCGNLSDDIIDQIEAFKDQIIAGDLVVPRRHLINEVSGLVLCGARALSNGGRF